jgi:hypothetical protein
MPSPGAVAGQTDRRRPGADQLTDLFGGVWEQWGRDLLD